MRIPYLVGGYVNVWWKRFAQFRGTFVLQLLAHTVHYGSDLIGLWILIDKFERIGTWSGLEVVLLLAFTRLSYGIANFFGRFSFRSLSWDIRQGDFDDVLIRPLSPAVYYVLKRLEFYDLYFIVFNAGVLAFLLIWMHIAFTPVTMLWLLLAIAGSSLIQLSLIMLANSTAFWFISSGAFEYFVVNQSSAFVNYPLSIYPRVLQVFLTFVLPWAFVGFFPVQYFLGKDDLLFHPMFQFLTPAVGAFLFGLALITWRLGIRRYQSTGT